MRLFFRHPVPALMLLLALGAGVPAAPTLGWTAEPPKGFSVPPQATPMPAFELLNFDGSQMRSTDLRDKVTVIRFWATW